MKELFLDVSSPRQVFRCIVRVVPNCPLNEILALYVPSPPDPIEDRVTRERLSERRGGWGFLGFHPEYTPLIESAQASLKE